MGLFGKSKTVDAVNGKSAKKEIPAGLWEKCKGCGAVLYKAKLDDTRQVCPECGYHYPMTAAQRIELLTDAGSWKEIDASLTSTDPLQFPGGAYGDKLVGAKRKTGLNDAVICGTASLDGRAMAMGIMDFRFLGASMGSVVGEKVTRITEHATANRLPLVILTTSGGARMYEGMLSLMQMAKTSAALARHAEAGLPYIVVLTHPTTAGVTASFASLGDVIVSEPAALVGFAGPRVVKQTTQAELPPGFQSAEFLQKKGFIDRVIPRSELRRELSLFLEYFAGSLAPRSRGAN
jgi:acetyl-CoA carboxylase carboxyl transferase subunit beta